MKKNHKIILLFITLISFIIPITVEGKTCKDYEKYECPNYNELDEYGKPMTDENGAYCATTPSGSGGNGGCDYADDSVQPCYEFNDPSRYDTATDCPTDRCNYISDSNSDDTSYAGYCMPKKQYITCDDLGKFTNLTGTDLCTVDQLQNTCSGDENGICYTYELYSKDPNEMLKCEDYYDDECPEGEKDYLGNTCRKNKETGECYSLMDQTKANTNATNKKTYGQDNYSRVKKSKKPFKCSDVKYLTGAWTLIRIAAPFIVILFGSLDFIKAVMASDEKKMKETKGKFIKFTIRRSVCFFYYGNIRI